MLFSLAGQNITNYIEESSIHLEMVMGQGAGTTTRGAGRAATCTFTVALGPVSLAIGAGSPIPTSGIPKLVRQGELKVYDNAGKAIFGGFVTNLADATDKRQVYTHVSCHDYWQDLDRIVINEVLTSMTDTAIIRLLFQKYAPLVNLKNLTNARNYLFPFKKYRAMNMGKALQTICDVTGFQMWIDADRVLHYQSLASSQTAPFALSDAPDNYNSYGFKVTKYELDDNAIINRVSFYGGKKTVPDFTQDVSPQANGNNTTFVLAYFPHPAGDGRIHVYKNNVELKVGRANGNNYAENILKSKGGVCDVLVNPDAQNLTFDIPPATGALVTCKYRFQVPLAAQLTNPASFAFFGRYFDGKIEDTQVFNLQTAQQRMRVLLSEQAYGLIHLTIRCKQSGLYPGQTIHIKDTTRGIDSTYQIQKVSLSPYGTNKFDYTVELGAWDWNLLDLVINSAPNTSDNTEDVTTQVIQITQHNLSLSATFSHFIPRRTFSGAYYAQTNGAYSNAAYAGFFTIKG